jgi:ribulose-bisphosphate carboxylase large chain
MARLSARYLIETAFPMMEAAEALAGEQSSGTFVKVPGETAELKERSAARVEEIVDTGSVPAPSLPGARIPKGMATSAAVYRQAEVTISWPLENMGTSLPNVLATVAGNLFELKQFSGLRLLDVQFPREFLDAYQGPQFGVAGTRELSGVYGRPLIGTIIKPSVGLSPAETAAMVETLASADIDFIKDDELQADGPHCRFEDRVKAVMRVLCEHASRSGKRVMYAFNVTGEINEMKRRHDIVREAGGTCVMVSLNSVGLPGLAALRAHSQLPIHAHRNGWGMYSRCPALGMSYIAYQKFWRLAGADHMHVNGLSNKFCEPDESVIASARECQKPMFNVPGRGCEAMPVFSSGQTARQAPGTYAALGNTDLIFACGGGLMAHPMGIAAGVRSLQQAWEAALNGSSLEEYGAAHPELRAALERFA